MSKETETKEKSRPVLRRNPPIWSVTRQELCETLPYYRTYHSGCYFTSAPRPAWFDAHKPTAQGAPSSAPEGSTSTATVALHRDITPYAYLLGGFGAPRDLWHAEGRVVISHGGGKSGRPDSSSGTEVEGDGREEKSSVPCGKRRKRNGKPQARLKLLSDQSSSDARVAALLSSMRDKAPVVLIMGKDYPLAHFRLREDISFAVLAWYYITDGWGERADGEGEEDDQGEAAVRWKFRFEYIESQGQPWWIGDENTSMPSPSSVKAALKTHRVDVPELSSRRRLKRRKDLFCVSTSEQPDSSAEYHCCKGCGVPSPRVYESGWTCLSPDCSQFWSFAKCAPESLRYRHDFLQLRPEPRLFAVGGMPFPLAPARSSAWTQGRGQEPSSDDLRGLHCIQCGRISCRRSPHYLQCQTCYAQTVSPSTVVAAPQLDVTTPTLQDTIVDPSSGIKSVFKTLQDRHGRPMEVASFLLDEQGDCAVHIVQGLEPEMDEIFTELQRGLSPRDLQQHSWEEVVPFMRHPLHRHTMKGDLLSQQFTFNYGVGYKHAVDMSTVPLSQAPKSAQSALALLEERTKAVLGDRPPPDQGDGVGPGYFNELYPVRYVDSQRMNFHDDGEPGLGPIISSLSLGVGATMTFRSKGKVRGSSNSAGEKKGVGAAVATKSIKVLRIPLRHGTVVIQQGLDLQRRFEHQVVPLADVGKEGAGGIRMALTARYIDASVNDKTTMSTKKRPSSGEIEPRPDKKR